MVNEYEGKISAPEDTYGRSLSHLEAHALPIMAAFLADMEECAFVAVGQKDNTVKLVHISADHGLTAPPPDVPSRVREINITLGSRVEAQDLMGDIRFHLKLESKDSDKLIMGGSEEGTPTIVKFKNEDSWD